MKILLPPLMLLILLESCGSRSSDSIGFSTRSSHSIVFGSYCGECIGRTCATMVRVDASGSYIDSTSYFNQMFNGGIYQFQGAKLPDSIHARIKHITGTIPARLWIENTIIGSPDAYDQCGYYIEVDGKQWEIDPDTHPEYLDPFLSGIDSALMIVGRANPQPSNQ